MAENVEEPHMESDEKMECDDAIDKNTESSSSDSDSEECDEDNDAVGNEQRIKELQQEIRDNPYLYNSHLELIKLLRQMGELERLREARECMSELFPLTEELWLDWLRDEIPLATEEAERNKIDQLFERAVKDYLSVQVWLEYVQYSIGGMGLKNGVDRIRSVFDRALTAAGIHVTSGSNLWEAYREFENAILVGLLPQAGMVATKEQEDEFQKQHLRVTSLFKRQLSIPLFDMQETMAEYKEWLQEEIDNFTKQQFEKAFSKLEKIKEYEVALMKADPPKLNEYQVYLDYEMKEDDPTRIQCLFERAIQDNCLEPALWVKYTKYLDSKLKMKSVVLPVYERSVRNCPWCSQLWSSYLLALERFSESSEKVKETLEKALVAGFSQGPEYLQVWITYIDYLRRRIKWDEDHKEELNIFRSNIDKAVEHLASFGKDSDPSGSLRQYWASIEAKFCKNIEKARELWNEIMTEGHGNEAVMWLEYYKMERMHGDNKHCRKVLQRGLNSVTDWPESIVEAYLLFEREEGSLEQYDLAVTKCDAQMERINERRAKKFDSSVAKVVNVNRTELLKCGYENLNAWLQNPSNVYIGRNLEHHIPGSDPALSKWGNPFTVEKYGRTECIKKYEHYLRNNKNLYNCLEELIGKNLGCWCHPEDCHGHVLVKIIEEIVKAAEKEAELSEKKPGKGDKKFQKKMDKSGGKQNQQGSDRGNKKQQWKQKQQALQLKEETNTEEFKIPAPPPGSKTATPPGFKGAAPPGYKGAPPPGFKGAPKTGPKGDDSDETEPPAKKQKIDNIVPSSEPEGGDNTHDTSKYNRTAFASNLNFSIEEDRIGKIFAECGELSDIRLVRNFKGKSKGYAYVEFKDELCVVNALKLDRMSVENRPMYVSKCEDKGQSKAQFRYSTSMEKNKLFIKGLPFTCTKEALEQIFKEHGRLKEVRLVTYKNGTPKGLAYVVYEDEQDASQAVMKTDGLMIGEYTISVSISNPPERKAPLSKRDEEPMIASLGSGKRETEIRGKARTQVSLVPRSVKKAPEKGGLSKAPVTQNSSNSSTANGSSPNKPAVSGMSNNDFRNMLLKK